MTAKKPLLSKIVNSIDNSKEKNGLKIYCGRNELSTLNDETEIVVVGSFIPQFLLYFYNESTYMYSGVDDARGTSLYKYKRKYPVDLNQGEKNRIINEIQEILLLQKIAFVDLAKRVLIKENSSRDKDIKEIEIDDDALSAIKKSKNMKKVISVTEDVEKILFHYGIENTYIKLFAGQSKRYPKGTNYKELWKNAFIIKK